MCKICDRDMDEVSVQPRLICVVDMYGICDRDMEKLSKVLQIAMSNAFIIKPNTEPAGQEFGLLLLLLLLILLWLLLLFLLL